MNDVIGQIRKRLFSISEMISRGDFGDVKSIQNWGGADVIIASKFTKKLQEWQDDHPVVIGIPGVQYARRVVITQYSKQLSWLFLQLRDAFNEVLNYKNKYGFYSRLAEIANNNENHDSLDVLWATYYEANAILNEMELKKVIC